MWKKRNNLSEFSENKRKQELENWKLSMLLMLYEIVFTRNKIKLYHTDNPIMQYPEKRFQLFSANKRDNAIILLNGREPLKRRNPKRRLLSTCTSHYGSFSALIIAIRQQLARYNPSRVKFNSRQKRLILCC